MIIENLELKNFKSYKDTQITFNQGITLILGENGAGKSSILEAISFALFKQVNGKIEDNVRKAQNDREIVHEMLVTLTFKHNGIIYQVKRGRRGSKSIAELYHFENKQRIINSRGDRNVTNDIETILEMDAKSFLNAIYIQQGEITELIEKTASERKEMITKLLNIDSLEKAWDEIKKIINTYETQKNINEGKLTKKEEIEQKTTEIQDVINRNKINIEQHKKEKETLQTQLEKIEIAVKENEEIKNKHEKLTTEAQIKQNEIQQQKELENRYTQEITQIIENEAKIKELEKEIKPLPKLKEIKELKIKRDSYKKDLNNINKNITDIKEKKTILENTKDNHQKYTNLKEEQETISKKIEELSIKEKENNIKVLEKKNHKDRKDYLYEKIQKTATIANDLFNKTFTNPEDIHNVAQEEKTKNEQLIQSLENKIVENKKSISSVETELKNTKKSLEELEKTEDTCPICQSEIPHEKHEELSNKYKNDIVNYELRIEELIQANKNQETRRETLKEMDTKIDNLNIKQLKEEFDEFNELLVKIKEMTKYDSIAQEIEKEVNDVKLKQEKNIELLKSLEDDYKQYNYANIRLNELPQIDDEIKKQEEINTKITEIKVKVKEISASVRIKDDIERTIKYLEKRTNECNQLKGTVSNKEHRIQDKENTVKNIQQKQQELTNINNQIKELGFNQEEYEKVSYEYTSCKDNLESIDKIIVKEETEQKLKKEEHEKYIKEKTELEKIAQQQQSIEDYIKLLTEIRNLYSKDGVQRDLRNIVRPEIEKNTMDIFSEFGFNYSSIELDEDYNLTVQSRQEKIDLNMLSGGEKIVIALALRLGIAKVITKTKMELLILDEPTIHLDTERRNDLIEIIRKINVVPQMIVVTHDDEMESLSNNIIKINKENGISSQI